VGDPVLREKSRRFLAYERHQWGEAAGARRHCCWFVRGFALIWPLQFSVCQLSLAQSTTTRPDPAQPCPVRAMLAYHKPRPGQPSPGITCQWRHSSLPFPCWPARPNTAIAGHAVARAAPAVTVPARARWAARRRAGVGMTGRDGLGWAGARWHGPRRSGTGWTGMAVLAWPGMGCADTGWHGLAWPAPGWTGRSWLHL